MIGFIGIVIVCYTIFTIGTMILVHFDFLNRKFSSNEEKIRWRNIIFKSVWGKFNYLFNVIIRKKIKFNSIE